ncbi:hypothetical protein M3651_09665 [Cytobacillus oceanisediminis]|nr:hypothetical protein [Cytobacillus oceanisediminis]MCM3392664.1 hypothetical protein [Cytobacillus oceanisediminis]
MNHRAFLALAIPLTVSTMTQPLLGAVDTAVIGQLPNPAYIGGVLTRKNPNIQYKVLKIRVPIASKLTYIRIR